MLKVFELFSLIILIKIQLKMESVEDRLILFGSDF